MPEQVDVTRIYAKQRLYRWCAGNSGTAGQVFLTLGRLTDDGRWFVEHTGELLADVYPTEEAAWARVNRWLRSGDWWPVPAAYDGRGRPCDARAWVQHGASWQLAPVQPVEE